MAATAIDLISDVIRMALRATMAVWLTALRTKFDPYINARPENAYVPLMTSAAVGASPASPPSLDVKRWGPAREGKLGSSPLSRLGFDSGCAGCGDGSRRRPAVAAANDETAQAPSFGGERTNRRARERTPSEGEKIFEILCVCVLVKVKSLTDFEEDRLVCVCVTTRTRRIHLPPRGLVFGGSTRVFGGSSSSTVRGREGASALPSRRVSLFLPSCGGTHTFDD